MELIKQVKQYNDKPIYALSKNVGTSAFIEFEFTNLLFIYNQLIIREQALERFQSIFTPIEMQQYETLLNLNNMLHEVLEDVIN